MTKKWMALLLAMLMMLLMLTACNSQPQKPNDDTKSTTTTEEVVTTTTAPEKADAEKLVGKWETTLDFGSVFKDQLTGSGMEEFISLDSFDMKMLFTFNSDGTYEVKIDEATMQKSMDAFITSMIDGMKQYFEEMIASTPGMEELTVDDLMDQIAQQNGGKSLEDTLREQIDINKLADEAKDTVKYELKDGKLCTTSDNSDETEEDTYQFEGDTLKLLDSSEMDNVEEGSMKEAIAKLYPLTLTRVAA